MRLKECHTDIIQWRGLMPKTIAQVKWAELSNTSHKKHSQNTIYVT